MRTEYIVEGKLVCINCVLMNGRVMDAVNETIADVPSVSPSSERMKGLLVKRVIY